jgi:menaquinone-dependent protoporphyrinogen oxidase
MKEAQLHQPVAISKGGFATVLISFATTEGQTRKIAERISANLRERGYEAKLYDTAVRRGVPEVGAFDAVIVAASIHEGHHQDSAINFAIAHRDQLVRKPSAFCRLAYRLPCQTGRPKLNIM